MNLNVTNNNPSFNAVIFRPANLNQWNPELLNTVLDSSFVRKTIKKNEAMGVDTFLSSEDHKVGNIKSSILEIVDKDGKGKRISNTGRFYADVLGKTIEELKALDIQANLENKLESLKEIANDVVFNFGK